MSETEQRLIASLLVKPKKILDCKCNPDDFTDKKMRDIFLAVKEVQESDYLQIAKKSGVDVYDLSRLTDNNVPLNIVGASRTIASAARKRRLLSGLGNLSSPQLSVDEILSGLMRLHRTEQSQGDKNYTARAVVDRFSYVQAENKERGALGLKTGFHFLDKAGIHLVPGHMWLIGALPGTGKTNTLIQLLVNLSCRSLVFSTEMTEEQLTARYLANKTGIDSKVILSGCMLKHHAALVEEEKEILRAKDLTIIDDVKDLGEIERIVRLENMRKSVDVVFIDYVQHVKTNARTKYEGASDISHTIQDLGKSCRLTTVNFSQVTISSHKEYTGNAQFKGAGDFAEDCDLGVRLMSKSDLPGKVKWVTEKNRHGVRPEQFLEYADNYTRLIESDYSEEDAQ